MVQELSVAEAKRRFSELIDRVRRGERFLISRRGKPALALVPPEEAARVPEPERLGFAAVAGALADWKDLEDVVEEIYQSRRTAVDRTVPELG